MTDEEVSAAARSESRSAHGSASHSAHEMVSIVGHDLRNPLNAAHLTATTLLGRGDLPAEVRAGLERLDRATRRMAEMVGALLDFGEGWFRGTVTIARTHGSLAEVARLVIEELQAAYPQRSIRFVSEGDGFGAWDAGRLAQVVSNLVANALVHGAEDSPVHVAIRDNASEVSLAVSNAGPAIPQHVLPHLFEPFRRGADIGGNSRAHGVGLGLYIAQQIVGGHAGSIDVKSSADAGTTFTVRLPRSLGTSTR